MPTITIVVSRRYPDNTTPNSIERRCLPLFCALPTLNEMSDGKSRVPNTSWYCHIDDEPYYAWTCESMLPRFKRAMHFHSIFRHSMCGDSQRDLKGSKKSGEMWESNTVLRSLHSTFTPRGWGSVEVPRHSYGPGICLAQDS
jgi:hypothetical protein